MEVDDMEPAMEEAAGTEEGILGSKPPTEPATQQPKTTSHTLFIEYIHN
jgi:hypothetical protein